MSTYSQALKELAEPRPIGDSVKAAIVRVSRITGIPYPRTFNVWYERARRIDAHEAQQIEKALQSKREEEARNEIHDLRTRLLKMESRLAAEAANSDRARHVDHRPSSTRRINLDRSLARER